MCFINKENALSSDQTEVPARELSRDSILSFINKLPRYTILTFTGGEPYMRKDFDEILQATATRHPCHIITNGMLLNDSRIQQLVELRQKGAFSPGVALVGVSLLGPRDVHDDLCKVKGSFEQVVDQTVLLSDMAHHQDSLKPLIDLKVVVTADNYESLPELLPTIRKIKPRYLTLQAESQISYYWYTPIPKHNQDVNHLDATAFDRYPPATHIPDIYTLKRNIEAIRQGLKGQGTRLRLYPHAPLERFIEQFDKPLTGRYHCSIPWYTMVVDAAGNVGNCIDGVYGNISEYYEDPLRMFNHPRMRAFRKLLGKHRFFKACRGCCWLEYMPW